MRIGGTLFGGSAGALTQLLEHPSLADEMPWYLPVLFALGVSVATVFVPEDEKYDQLAETLTGLSGGLWNVAMGSIQQRTYDTSEKTQAQLAELLEFARKFKENP